MGEVGGDLQKTRSVQDTPKGSNGEDPEYGTSVSRIGLSVFVSVLIPELQTEVRGTLHCVYPSHVYGTIDSIPLNPSSPTFKRFR